MAGHSGGGDGGGGGGGGGGGDGVAASGPTTSIGMGVICIQRPASCMTMTTRQTSTHVLTQPEHLEGGTHV